jgi:hypothetical protein
MDKKKMKLIENETLTEVNGLDKRLYDIFALKDVLADKPFKQKLTTEDIFLKFLTSDKRWIEDFETTFKDIDSYIENYLTKLKEVVFYDRLYNTFGYLREFEDLSNAINEFVKYAITPLSNEYRYKQVKLIEKEELLSDISFTALKINTYNICDNLRNEWGDKITRYCTDNDNNIIIELVEEEYKTKSSNSSMNLKEHMSFQELKLLREKIKTGEKFNIYRGFSIEDTDRVRQGLKCDGDIYYLQSAGTGLSYTLNESVAWRFVHRHICGEYIDEDFKQNRYFITKEKWYVPSDKYIETKGRQISAVRDKKKLKPIICKYECDPKKITGFFFVSNEAEVMIKPEDLKVIRYNIPHSNTIAERYWESINRTCSTPFELSHGAIANGLTAFPTLGKNDYGYIYAETERVRDTLEGLIDCGRNVDQYSRQNAYNVFMENSVELPEDINPFAFGDGLFEYMKNPTNIKRRKNKHYKVNKNKWKKTIQGAKGFKAKGFKV